MTPQAQSGSLSETILAGGGEMGALIRSHDWSTTPLGPVENWSQSLRTSVSTMLASRFAHTILWGEDVIQLYNDAMIAIYGAYHPKALGQPMRETWSEIWDDQLKLLCEGIRNTGVAVFVEDQLYPILRFGYLEETYFTFCYSPIWDEAGKISGIFATAIEMTQQVIGQRRLTMLRELATAGNGTKTRTSACLAAADAINPYDIPFALFYQVNEQGNLAERVALSGLSVDSVAAPREIDLTDRSSCWSLGDVLQSREPLLITDVVDRFGSLPVEPWGESPHSAFILPILSSNKEQVECLLVAGISPRLQFNAEYRSFLELVAQQVESSIATARSYEQERQRAEALAELDRAKTEFFSNVSHEFRTPLTLMLGPAEDALTDRDDPLSPNQRQRIEVMQRNGLRLLKLVNTLLDFSRIESDRISAVYEQTDLATFTAELASVFRACIEKANLRLVVDCPPLPEPVYVDREMWEKIVLNLISNAFKFTFTGAITVRLHQVGDSVELAVQDTGIGIPAAEIPRLFERFHRVKGAQGRTFEGSGIGLSLCEELVKLHGGTLKVSSVKGEGSCFSVLIPTGRAHLSAERIGANRTITSTPIGAFPYVEEVLQWLPQEDLRLPIADFGLDRNSNEQTENLKSQIPNPKSQILLVDDNADMRDYLKRLLSQRAQVETAANGAIALNLIQQKLPDLVLTDVMMPEVDGFALLKALRANPATKSLPIILLSARAGEEATIEGLEAGADDYLIKPFSARELVARVETQLQMSRLRQEQSANRLKNEFLMTVTHELQAPLAAILGWARLLQTKPFDQTKMARALATIERNATIEAKLVKDLLDISSILSGKFQLQLQRVNLVTLTKEIVTTLRETTQAKQIQLVETIPDGVEISVLGNPDRLRQIIINLLSNAIKFTAKGGQVNIRLERLGSVAQITVTDTGIGIAQSFLPQVFDRFSQAEVPSSHSPGGVGIGLAIARHLVELHHGTIEAASEGEGRGATFTVKLPLV
ncbi:histidine kinase [Chroococcidiopsis sp. CCALA 051]|uniref:ATP-binding protein n=1 Tax=Chroococcidiopsis sp. CCALA 051 TaxID=869949 RepID=UPI000D0D7EB0|nr:ATP-binding protein [Chroococcidiopsis sp. CCALA 051]PSM50208.1 histidine kinase [Chroococcidiopsis sp. CCALA 051]